MSTAVQVAADDTRPLLSVVPAFSNRVQLDLNVSNPKSTYAHQQSFKAVGYERDEWLTPKETAVLIGCSIDTLKRWRSQQRGPVYFQAQKRKRGQPVRYRRQDVELWLKEHFYV